MAAGVPLSGDGIGAACDAQELPLTKEDCKKDGWKRFDGTATFRNQVDCSFPVAAPLPSDPWSRDWRSSAVTRAG